MRKGIVRLVLVIAAAQLTTTVVRAGDEPLTLRETFNDGYTYRVSCSTDFSGSLQVPSGNPKDNKTKPLKVSGSSSIEYDERVLEAASGGPVGKTLRLYRRIDFQRKIENESQKSTIRPEVRRMVVLHQNQHKAAFSLEGPLTWEELDLIRTDVFTPELSGLLPDHPVRIGEHWTAAPGAVKELTDMEKIEEGKIDCWFDEITEISHRRQARIGFKGFVRGIGQDGTNRQPLDGYILFDLTSKHISYLSLRGGLAFLERDGTNRGGIEGRFVLTRQANVEASELTNSAVSGKRLDPNEDNSQLLYKNSQLGIQLTYPRRWHVNAVQGWQLTLDEAKGGSGILLTVEPIERVPSGEEFLRQTKEELQRRGLKIIREERVRRVQDAPRLLEQFSLFVEEKGRDYVMSFFVGRQAEGGLTIAARLPARDQAALDRDVLNIVRSVVVEKPR
ncbi:hypothetical protein BH10PLA2_BH10PLA2_02970 [soil metagenome]